jgi:hypothetical protein
MIRLSVVRLVAGLLAAVGGLSVPAAALAHGVAHGREARAHVVERHAAGSGVDHDVRRDAGGRWHRESPVHGLASHDRLPEVSAADGRGDHAHQQVGEAVSSSVRLHLPGFVAPLLPAVVPPVDVLHVASAALLLTAAPPRAGPAQRPPPPSRAPPID